MLTANLFKSKNDYWLILASLMLIPFYLLVFYPLTQAGFFYDDAHNSLLSGTLRLEDKNLSEYILAAIIGSITSSGRMYPLSTLAAYPQYIFTDPFEYQLCRMVFIFLSVASFAWLIKLITKKSEIGLLFLFLIPVFWSVQRGCDSLTSFSILMQILAIFSGLSLCFYIKARESNDKIFYTLSLALYLCALLTYEIGIAVFFAILCLEWLQKKSLKDFLINISGYLAITATYSIATLALRYCINPTISYDGVMLGELKKVPSTFIKQLLATLPLNAFNHFLSGDLKFTKSNNHNIFLVILPISLFCFYRLLIRLEIERQSVKKLVIIACCCFFIPALIISFIGKYQIWLSGGISYGYLPLYLQYFGLSILFLAWCNKRLACSISAVYRRRMTILISTLASLTLYASIEFNYGLISKINKDYEKDVKLLAAEALRNGLLSEISYSTRSAYGLVSNRIAPKNIILSAAPREKDRPPLIIGTLKFFPPSFVAQHSNLIANTLAIKSREANSLPNNIKSSGKKTFSKDQQVFLLNPVQTSSESGYVIFAKINSVDYKLTDGDLEITSYSLSNPRIFLRGKSTEDSSKIFATLNKFFASKQSPKIYHADKNDWKIIDFSNNNIRFTPE